TGVQTCALPIWAPTVRAGIGGGEHGAVDVVQGDGLASDLHGLRRAGRQLPERGHFHEFGHVGPPRVVIRITPPTFHREGCWPGSSCSTATASRCRPG